MANIATSGNGATTTLSIILYDGNNSGGLNEKLILSDCMHIEGSIDFNGINNTEIDTIITENQPFIIASNNSTLIVKSSDLPIMCIHAITGADLTFHNNYTGKSNTWIKVDKNSKMTLTGADMDLTQVTLEPQSQLNFTHHGAKFHLSPQGISDNMIIKNIHELVDSCALLSNYNFDTEISQLPLNQTNALTVYSDNKEEANLIFAQNPIAKPAGLDRYIDTHLFETNAINHSFTSSDLQNDTDLIGNTTSSLDDTDII